MFRRVLVDTDVILDLLEAIVTRNRRDYKVSKLAVVSAEECLELAGL